MDPEDENSDSELERKEAEDEEKEEEEEDEREEEDESGDEEEDDFASKSKLVGEKVAGCKYGLLYLSYIPDGLNVKLLRGIMEEFGPVGRIYLEPESLTKKRRTYSEGWVEFLKKRHAKRAAKALNGSALQFGKKRCKMNGQVWSVKYLHRFKWAHLTEQLAHDRAVSEQKRRFEMSQAKKQVDFYQKMTERSRRMKGRPRAGDASASETPANNNKPQIRQKKPVDRGSEMAVQVDPDLLSSIFKKV